MNMLNFNFKLQKVLEYKETVEKLKQSDYGKAKKKLEEEEDKLNNFVESIKSLNEERQESIDKTTICNLKLYNSYLTNLNSRANAQKDVVNETEELVINARTTLIESMREKKTFEQIKSKHYDEFLYQSKREESKLNDQIVSYKFCIK